MEHAIDESSRKIESLTRNLLECYEELDLIYRTSRRLISNLNAQDSVELILNEAMEIFEADSGWVVPADAQGELFAECRERVDNTARTLLGEGIVTKLLREGQSRSYRALKSEPRYAGTSVPDAFLCALVKTDKDVYGALCLGRNRGREGFSSGDFKLANVLASQAAIAIENALLHTRRMEEQQAMIRMQEEMRLARSIQDNLLPKSMPSPPGYDIAGHTAPARDVGGDYYDFIPVGSDRVALCLGDVSGKGMPAALLMAHLQAAVRGQTLMEATPGECLHRSNTLLFHSTDTDRFATCFYGILDTAGHGLRYANAGHDHPMLFREGRLVANLDVGGMVLGVVPETGYEEATVELHREDVLVLYSDGIIDAADPTDRAFGLERFRELVGTRRGQNAGELVREIMAGVETFAQGAPPTDDMTLLVIRRTG